jgi:hypothetical protein
MKKVTDTKVNIGPVRLSYMSVFKPRRNETRNEDEFSVTLLIPKKPHENLADPNSELKGIADTIKVALAQKFPQEPPKWTSPLKDGDKELNNDGEAKHPGYWYISTRAKVDYPPVLIDGNRNKVSGGWESGDWGIVQLNFYPYDTSGNKGVSSSLRAIQFLYRDEHFGNSSDPEAIAGEFDAVANAHSTPVPTVPDEEEFDPFE